MTGRPSLYNPAYAEQARKLCLLGATDELLADFFGVCRNTVLNWRTEHEDFREACHAGKNAADSDVAEALYKRATGWSHRAVKIFADPKTGAVLEVPYVEQYPPDSTAMIWWLKNRQPERWRDRPPELPPEDVESIAKRVGDALREMRDADGA